AEFGAHHLQLNTETVYAGEWLHTCIEQCAPEAQAAAIELIIDIHEPVRVIRINTHLMNRAVHNLVRNALRYAHHQVYISLQTSSGRIKLQVDDDGPGIPKQHREHIFQPFTRLDYSRNKQSGGHGLGLAITQKIAQQHGGTISVVDSAQGGAGFQLEWPG
nr:ATP-binding protein [Gammaproteobacteria bacterium]